MKPLITIAFLLLINGSLSAQFKLSGTVHDNLNLPLPYAGVTLSNLSSHQTQTITTDSTGSFIFKQIKSGKYQLSSTYTGFQPVMLILFLRADTLIRLRLIPAEKQLNEITVTAAKAMLTNHAGKLTYNVSSSITATGTDGLTAVSQVPGVKVSNNEISSAGKGQLKVTINGQLVQLTGLDLMRYLKSMSASQISKIELIKNPSASYDADGNAGIINIVTKQSKKQGYSGNVQFNAKRWIHDQKTIYGTSNYYALNGGANLFYNSEKLSVYGNLNLDQDHHLEGFRTDIYYPKQTWLQSDTGNYTYKNINLIAGADYKLSPKTTIGFSYLGGRNVYDGSDHVNNPVYNSSGKLDSTLKTYATYHPIANSNSVNMHTVINFDTTGKKLLLNADYYNYYRTDRSDFESNSYLPGNSTPVNDTRYFDTNKQNINIYTFKADAELPIRYGTLAFGGKLSFINNYSNAFYYQKVNDKDLVYDTNLSNEFDYRENTQSLYANISQGKDKWKYQAGLRAEITQTRGYSYTINQTTNNNYVKLFPSLLISYQADQDDSFSFTYGKRINRPSFWNLNPFKSLYTAYSYGQGNPYLQPEYNNNFEFSHTYQNNLTSALFLNITDNGFNSVTIARADTNLVYTTPLNFIKTYRYGLTESYALKLVKWLENNNQATFFHTNAYSDNSSFNNIKGYGLYLSTSNTVYFNEDKTFAAAANFWYQFPEIDHIGRSGTSYKLDLGLTALVFQKNLNITLNVNDVFKSSATNVITYVNGIKQQFTNFQINRYAQLSLSYRFGNKQTKSKTRETGNADELGRNH